MFRRLSLLALFLALPLNVARAATTTVESFSFQLPNPLGCDAEGIFCVVEILIDALYTIAIPVTVIMIIWAGYQFLTAGGNEEKISQARKTILYVVIGFAVIILSGAFRGIIESLLSAPAPTGQLDELYGRNP